MKENKTQIICIRLSNQERDLMDEFCEEIGTTPSRLIRRVLMEKFSEKNDVKIPHY